MTSRWSGHPRLGEELDELERVALAVFTEEREVVADRRGLADIDWRATPVATHRIGNYAAVLLFLRHREAGYGRGVCGEVYLGESTVRDGARHWGVLCGGGGGWNEMEDYWRDNTFSADPATACGVDDDFDLTTVAGYTAGRQVIGFIDGEAAGRLAVAQHGIFCFAGLVKPGQELTVREAHGSSSTA